MLHKFLARSIQTLSEMNKLYVTISARAIPDGHAVLHSISTRPLAAISNPESSKPDDFKAGNLAPLEQGYIGVRYRLNRGEILG